MKDHYNDLHIDISKSLFTGYDLEHTLNIMSEHLIKVTGVERCSIFIYNKKDKELFTILSTGIEKIHVSTEKGIVGYVFRTGESIIENNVIDNPHFLSDVDKKSGFTTLNIAACPILNTHNETIGVLELLNKPNGFDESELRYLKSYANYINSVLELVPFYFDQK